MRQPSVVTHEVGLPYIRFLRWTLGILHLQTHQKTFLGKYSGYSLVTDIETIMTHLKCVRRPLLVDFWGVIPSALISLVSACSFYVVGSLHKFCSSPRA